MVVCLLSALNLSDNSYKYMIAHQAMAAFLPEKEQSRGILALTKSRKEFFTNFDLYMLITSKCSMAHYVRYSSEINVATVLYLVQFESEVDEGKLHWFQFLQSAVQVDKGNTRGVGRNSNYKALQ